MGQAEPFGAPRYQSLLKPSRGRGFVIEAEHSEVGMQSEVRR